MVVHREPCRMEVVVDLPRSTTVQMRAAIVEALAKHILYMHEQIPATCEMLANEIAQLEQSGATR
eukprot:3043460-Pleurochrysis_carterae.AAC.1